MIICSMRKWYDDLFHAKYIDLSECRRTSASDSDISIREEVCDIILTDPFDSLSIFHFLEVFFHSFIEFSESDDPLIIFISSKLIDNTFKYRFCSLASTDNEDM
jgi:hypothetical protein